MKIHVEAWDSYLYNLIDLETKKEIKGVQWANDETGKYEVFLRDKTGGIRYEKGKLITEVRKGRIKIVKKVGKFKSFLAYLLKFINKTI